MHLSRRLAVGLLATAAFAGSATTAVTALAGGSGASKVQEEAIAVIEGKQIVLSSSLVGSVPSDPVIHGVTAGGAPWAIKPSVAFLLKNGTLIANIRGLVIPELGTPGPVTEVDVALYCGADTMAAATSKSVPLNAKGNAFIADRLRLPARCLAPQLLINPNKIPQIYIGGSGFAS